VLKFGIVSKIKIKTFEGSFAYLRCYIVNIIIILQTKPCSEKKMFFMNSIDIIDIMYTII